MAFPQHNPLKKAKANSIDRLYSGSTLTIESLVDSIAKVLTCCFFKDRAYQKCTLSQFSMHVYAPERKNGRKDCKASKRQTSPIHSMNYHCVAGEGRLERRDEERGRRKFR